MVCLQGEEIKKKGYKELRWMGPEGVGNLRGDRQKSDKDHIEHGEVTSQFQESEKRVINKNEFNVMVQVIVHKMV